MWHCPGSRVQAWLSSIKYQMVDCLPHAHILIWLMPPESYLRVTLKKNSHWWRHVQVKHLITNMRTYLSSDQEEASISKLLF